MIELRGLAFLLLLQAVGEAVVRAFKLPYPGPVVGLILLLPALQLRFVREPVSAAADLLLAHLSLLFVPVGVGVITHLDLLEKSGLQLLVAIVVSTWVGMIVTALVLRALIKPSPPEQIPGADSPTTEEARRG
jgi:holin-like protein